MKEYILFVYSDSNPFKNSSEEKQQQHIAEVSNYVQSLAQQNKMKQAIPLEPKGITISGNIKNFRKQSLDTDSKYVAGYYHIIANDIDEAMEIAQADPRFKNDDWAIEIRPVKQIEGLTKKSSL